MLSPFGLDTILSAPGDSFGHFPDAMMPPRLAPTGASRSVGDLLSTTPHPSETVSSLGDAVRPKVKVYNEFGRVQYHASKVSSDSKVC